MKLHELLKDLTVLNSNVDLGMEILGVTYDSRKVQPGWLFVAVTGYATDGNLYIPMALSKGAVAVVTAKEQAGDVPYVQVPSDREALARIGANLYGHPGKAMKVIAVTGTNGKTSSTLLLKHVLEVTRGAKVGLMGTMDNMIGDVKIPTERTTPESLDLQCLLGQMRDAGCTHVVMEASSHAIYLQRVGSLLFDVAAFTNLTEDHLDFHETMENYCDAKALLFAQCKKGVVNSDDPWAQRIMKQAKCPIRTTSVSGKADLWAENVELMSDGISFEAVTAQERVSVQVGIPGKFTVYNVLTVLGCALELGIGLQEAADALGTAQGVKGRVEVVPTPGKDYTVLIDYAHTPDGLENVLRAVKGYCKGRVIAVFGCGGDRDPLKRPIMGSIGVRFSDLGIITSDNPRTEVPMAIIEDILRGVKKEFGEYFVIEDRRAAIRYAMDIAEKDDIIVLAGKGHETYQDIGGHKYHLDEREEVALHLQELRK